LNNEQEEHQHIDYGPLTHEQVNNIAIYTHKKITDQILADIGREVVRKVVYFLGAATLALALWAWDWVKFIPPKK
jgi:hypothetical protein